MKPEPVPSTFAFSSSMRLMSPEEFLGLLTISRSLMKTTEGDVSYNKSNITLPVKVTNTCTHGKDETCINICRITTPPPQKIKSQYDV